MRLRATNARRLGEVELAVIQLAHPRQALAEGVQARRLGLQFAELDRQRVQIALAARLGLVDFDAGQVGNAVDLVEGERHGYEITKVVNGRAI